MDQAARGAASQLNVRRLPIDNESEPPLNSLVPSASTSPPLFIPYSDEARLAGWSFLCNDALARIPLSPPRAAPSRVSRSSNFSSSSASSRSWFRSCRSRSPKQVKPPAKRRRSATSSRLERRGSSMPIRTMTDACLATPMKACRPRFGCG